MRTVQTRGLRGVVAFHAADRGTLAVQMANQAVESSGSTGVAQHAHRRSGLGLFRL